MEKLSFQPPSRALWHDHIFFLGDFNYRLNIPRVQVEQFVKNENYKQLIEYDQLKKEHTEERVFREFNEGQIHFPPTYKYDIGSDEYDTSEKARTPSYTDRILWRSLFPDVQTKQLYYGRAEVKTSDHRPVSAMFDVDIEICDEEKMYKEYVNIYERFKPSNAQIVYDMKNDLNLRKKQLIEEFDFYVKKKYGLDITITDRL
jgi:phosphatidylinositol-bisphosphatase